MRIYADSPGPVAQQVAVDLLFGCWVEAALAVPAVVGMALRRAGHHITRVIGQATAAAGQLRSSSDPQLGFRWCVGHRGAVADPGRDSRVGAPTMGRDGVRVHRAAVIFAITAGLLTAVGPVVVRCLTRGRWISPARPVRKPLSEDDLQALACAAAATSRLRALTRLPAGTLFG